MAASFVKLWRDMIDSPVMRDDWLCRLWCWCRMRASFKGDDKGTFCTGRHQAAAELDVAPSRWYRGIERLAALGYLEVKSDSNRTRITVLDFDTYVVARSKSEQQMNSERTANEHPSYLDVEGKNGRSAASPETGSQPPVLPVLEFPCVGPEAERHGNLWPLMPAKLAEYRQAFPGVDALSECRKALQWCLDNPIRRKTFGGMPKFLGSWLGRAQDRVGMKGGVPAAVPLVEDRVKKTAEEMRRRREEDARQRAEAIAKVPPIVAKRPEPEPGDVLRFPHREGGMAQ